jgi:phenylalanyl-tRNA synthetase beta chain
MLISLSWLKKYVDIPVRIQTLVEDLTMAGLNVEKCTSVGITDERIIVGEVEEVSRHPNADKLKLCRVRLGEGRVQEVVCGAPNVEKGQKVAVALVGASLPGGMKIKKAKIRGVVSEGMICSEKELGLGEDAAGIMVLDDSLEVGAPLSEALSTSDTILEIEVTPNRPDLLSHFGVAREVAALYKLDLEFPEAAFEETDAAGHMKVVIDDENDCPRYTGRIIRGVKVGPSPSWLVKALESVGINSINNIVDATNFVMLELGQPLHAFDLSKLRGGVVRVRRGGKGESLNALDGESYELGDEHLVIADGEGAVALAGIIGGVETAVSNETRDIFLESACFDPVVVRRARKALNTTTEASYRFERGADRGICKTASDRACSLILELAGGRAGGFIDVYPAGYAPVRISLRRKEVQRVLGVGIHVDEIKAILESLEFKCVEKTEEELVLEVPSFRPDVVEEVDLIEEVARIYGYNRIGKGWDFRCTTYAREDRFDEFVESVLDHLCARGFDEVITSSFGTGGEAGIFGWAEDDARSNPIRLRNPLTSLHSCMRTSLLPGMLDVVKLNIDMGVKRMKICQAGKVFLRKRGEEGLPDERMILELVMTRPMGSDFWFDSKKEMYLFDTKAVIEELARSFKVDLWHDFCYDFDGVSGEFFYSRGENRVIEGGPIGRKAAEKYDFEQAVWHVSIDLERFYKAMEVRPAHRPLPEYPVSKRDLSLIAPEGVGYDEIEKTLVKTGGALIESLKLFDVYYGENIPEGTRAYGVRIHFRSPERTLTDKEIDKLVDKILRKLKSDLKVSIRS